MKYWWVNHNQTVRQELGGGFIWSPKTNQNGSKNQGYINLTLAAQGDIIFSYANQVITAIGIIDAPFVEAIKPSEFGRSGDGWHPDGYLVKVFWLELDQTLRPKPIIEQLQHLLPTKYSPLQQNGNGQQNVYLAEISDAMGETVLGMLARSNVSIIDSITDYQDQVLDQATTNVITQKQLQDTTKSQLIQARVGQGIYRKNLLAIEKSCRLTGVNDPTFLIASHIKPWRVSNDEERLDGHNGLLLSPHVDSLFDKGWLSFKDNGNVLWAAPPVTDPTVEYWKLRVQNVGSFSVKQRYYLDYHREFIYHKRLSV